VFVGSNIACFSYKSKTNIYLHEFLYIWALLSSTKKSNVNEKLMIHSEPLELRAYDAAFYFCFA
jgi:hypothetical protein